MALTPLLLILVPVCLLYALIQYTTWTLASFRQGIPALHLSESFPTPIPSGLIGRLVEVEDMSFKFLTPQEGLFRTRDRMFRRPPAFPLLGEFILSPHGVASIKVRIPLAAVMCWLVFFLAIILATVEGASSFGAVGLGVLKGIAIMALITGLLYAAFLVEKDVLIKGLAIIKKYLDDQSER